MGQLARHRASRPPRTGPGHLLRGPIRRPQRSYAFVVETPVGAAREPTFKVTPPSLQICQEGGGLSFLRFSTMHSDVLAPEKAWSCGRSRWVKKHVLGMQKPAGTTTD